MNRYTFSSFLSFIDKESSERGCWLWKGGKSPKGYGLITYQGVAYRAHRLSWKLLRGEIPDGLWVLHKCDTPACVNPEHLFLGTVQDNDLDKMIKGRCGHVYMRGELNGNHKLSSKDVFAIRAFPRKYGSTKYLAREYGVDMSTISSIKSGKFRRYDNEN